MRQALRDVGAVEVSLDGGGSGWVLADDTEPVGPVDPWVALLPALDPTTMGWSERDWYLGPHRAQVFDTAGNGGATVWVDGRIVGGWSTKDGAVELVLLEDVGADARAALDAEADRLTAWLHGTPVLPRSESQYRTVTSFEAAWTRDPETSSRNLRHAFKGERRDDSAITQRWLRFGFIDGLEYGAWRPGN